jgi:hypothetical protein
MISRSVLLRIKNISDKIIDKIKTQVYVQHFFHNRAVYDEMWKNILEPGRPT